MGLNLRELFTGTFSLALQFQAKTTPPRIRYTLGKVMVFQHIGDGQILNGNLIATKKHPMHRLKLKILALIRYTLMASGDNLTLFLSKERSFLPALKNGVSTAKILMKVLSTCRWVLGSRFVATIY